MGGTCKKCRVKGCAGCDGDPRGCSWCLDTDPGEGCDASFVYDRRTRACVRLDGLISDC